MSLGCCSKDKNGKEVDWPLPTPVVNFGRWALLQEQAWIVDASYTPFFRHTNQQYRLHLVVCHGVRASQAS